MPNIKETFTPEQIEFLKTEEGMEFIVNNFTRVKKQELIAALKQSVSIPESMESISVLNQDVEQVEKLPELETENHKIDINFSTEDKLQNGRTKETDTNGIIYLKKDLGGDAYVREYLEGVDKEYVGEQKFNRAAVNAVSGLKDKLPKNYEQFEKIMRKSEKIRGENYSEKIRLENHQDFMQKYFSKNGKLMLSGHRNPHNEKFCDIHGIESCRLGDATDVDLGKCDTDHYDTDPRFGFSIRLLKSA